jgi:hypothetical protein
MGRVKSPPSDHNDIDPYNNFNIIYNNYLRYSPVPVYTMANQCDSTITGRKSGTIIRVGKLRFKIFHLPQYPTRRRFLPDMKISWPE